MFYLTQPSIRAVEGKSKIKLQCLQPCLKANISSMSSVVKLLLCGIKSKNYYYGKLLHLQAFPWILTVAHLPAQVLSQPSDIPTKQRLQQQQEEILTFWSDETEFGLSASNKLNAIGSRTEESINMLPYLPYLQCTVGV